MPPKREKSPIQKSPSPKAPNEKALNDSDHYRQKITPLLQFLRKHKLKFTQITINSIRIEYFRLDEFDQLIAEHDSIIKSNKELSKLVNNLPQILIYYRRPKEIKSKYPSKLESVEPSSEQKKYASFSCDTTESHKLRAILILFLILMIVLFPVWPYTVKYTIWLISLSLLTLITGVLGLRILLYLLCMIFGYKVWLLPNLTEDNGFKESFTPLISAAKSDRNYLSIAVRVLAVSLFVALVLHIYLHPEFLEEQMKATEGIIVEVHDWGVRKIKNQGNFSQRALTKLETILNDTIDVAEDGERVSDYETGAV